jgi:type I restriction enzyme S subunit
MAYEQLVFQDLLAEPLRNGVYKPKEYHGAGVPIFNMGEL